MGEEEGMVLAWWGTHMYLMGVIVWRVRRREWYCLGGEHTCISWV